MKKIVIFATTETIDGQMYFVSKATYSQGKVNKRTAIPAIIQNRYPHCLNVFAFEIALVDLKDSLYNVDCVYFVTNSEEDVNLMDNIMLSSQIKRVLLETSCVLKFQVKSKQKHYGTSNS